MLEISLLIVFAFCLTILPLCFFAWQLYKIKLEIILGYRYMLSHEKSCLIGGPLVFVGSQMFKAKAADILSLAFSELFIVIGGAMAVVGLLAFMKEMHSILPPSNKNI